MLKVQEIHELIKRIDESTIDEFTFESNGTKISLKKNQGEVLTTQNTPVIQQMPSENIVAKEVKTQDEELPKQTEETKKTKNYDFEITSPMVGTFYSAPSPDKDDYVKVGDKVNQDTTVCIVEAMKLFNEIEADVNGEIVEVLAENGELVEYGQPLFRVKTI